MLVRISSYRGTPAGQGHHKVFRDNFCQSWANLVAAEAHAGERPLSASHCFPSTTGILPSIAYGFPRVWRHFPKSCWALFNVSHSTPGALGSRRYSHYSRGKAWCLYRVRLCMQHIERPQHETHRYQRRNKIEQFKLNISCLESGATLDPGNVHAAIFLLLGRWLFYVGLPFCILRLPWPPDLLLPLLRPHT
ncbi:hypothetical protein RSAG8_12977, partial [Rhizoctonia solani AG-8 WAC10335]